SAAADDDARDVGRVAAERHEVDERDGALGRLEVRFEDERMLTIAPADRRIGRARRDQPPSVFRPAEEGGEAGARVEARPAEPVDRPRARNERGRLAVADERE